MANLLIFKIILLILTSGLGVPRAVQQCKGSRRAGEGSDASKRRAGEQAEGREGTRKREAGGAKEETRIERGGRKRILKRKLSTAPQACAVRR